MIYNVYAIYDRVAGRYTEPHLEVNNGTANRWFANAMRQSQLTPTDFELYRIGLYNVETSEYQVIKPELICKGDALSE